MPRKRRSHEVRFPDRSARGTTEKRVRVTRTTSVYANYSGRHVLSSRFPSREPRHSHNYLSPMQYAGSTSLQREPCSTHASSAHNNVAAHTNVVGNTSVGQIRGVLTRYDRSNKKNDQLPTSRSQSEVHRPTDHRIVAAEAVALRVTPSTNNVEIDGNVQSLTNSNRTESVDITEHQGMVQSVVLDTTSPSNDTQEIHRKKTSPLLPAVLAKSPGRRGSEPATSPTTPVDHSSAPPSRSADVRCHIPEPCENAIIPSSACDAHPICSPADGNRNAQVETYTSPLQELPTETPQDTNDSSRNEGTNPAQHHVDNDSESGNSAADLHLREYLSDADSASNASGESGSIMGKKTVEENEMASGDDDDDEDAE